MSSIASTRFAPALFGPGNRTATAGLLSAKGIAETGTERTSRRETDVTKVSSVDQAERTSARLTEALMSRPQANGLGLFAPVRFLAVKRAPAPVAPTSPGESGERVRSSAELLARAGFDAAFQAQLAASAGSTSAGGSSTTSTPAQPPVQPQPSGEDPAEPEVSRPPSGEDPAEPEVSRPPEEDPAASDVSRPPPEEDPAAPGGTPSTGGGDPAPTGTTTDDGRAQPSSQPAPSEPAPSQPAASEPAPTKKTGKEPLGSITDVFA